MTREQVIEKLEQAEQFGRDLQKWWNDTRINRRVTPREACQMSGKVAELTVMIHQARLDLPAPPAQDERVAIVAAMYHLDWPPMPLGLAIEKAKKELHAIDALLAATQEQP